MGAVSLLEGVSILVCCFNSARRLPMTLKHIAEQLVPYGLPVEVIIIDNNSSDDTLTVAASQWAKYSVSDILFRSVTEYSPGLSNARMRGIMEARYEVLIFCDDDNWLCRNYAAAAFDLLTTQPHVAIAGGDIKATFEKPPPKWFSRFEMFYSVGSRYFQSADITESVGSVVGAGMIDRAAGDQDP